MIGLSEGLITNALYDVAKKILKKDPIRSALDQTIDEITREKHDGWYELREIDRNQKEIFNNINIIEKATFLKIVIDNGVSPEIALRLYMKFSEKFKENIKEAAKKEPEVFFHYAIREFENIKTNNEELLKLLIGFANKNEIYLDRIIKHFKELEKQINNPINQQNKHKITDILIRGREHFFKYDNKYICGILKREDGVIALSYYRQFNDVKDIKHCLLTGNNCITFSSDKFEECELISFKDLYKFIVEEKKELDSTKILDDIISN
ncbi:MAG: hypothetical protein MPEBLZ_01095 [Candidatus Methanoperedens nitroreducens]|uniref:Uncharacterized protein n=1 Tax=Candidatus Methanoperedens nitratireducens TaxID=1392998 RepID=A0A0P8A842_9EURY|nr:hypothetical protein [Candidatus Methanoperedens sp. BLZ2]KAB2948370.1 MAG: hypothetical protein F9K14_00620 [Candidatus Methanoperedens sp.]KPQ44339.1 MAG: hypothetical protein MPEBLZ_01095 [Candidatus Methanoperedens sp. BLZ1]MBZ0174545.1 hypothetical protein [Candidatus Methanoperedens nitroreducens]CAG0989708.1 hypothetical protein METP2_02499 [Methanosarcinales archaeon]MCX9078570.1 hypothetical protein [Candidatus Methanoperedens sp.]